MQRIDVQDVSDVIEQVYDAALNPSLWNLALDGFCQLFEAEGAYLSAQQSLSTSENIAHSPSTQRIQNHVFHGAALHPKKGVSVFFTLKRDKKIGELSPEQSEVFSHVAKHIERALSIGELLEQQNSYIAAVENIYTQQHFGFILLNKHGQIILASQQAKHIAENSTALCLNNQGIQASRWPDQQALSQTQAKAINASTSQLGKIAETLTLNNLDDSPPVTILVCSVKQYSDQFSDHQPAVFIVIGNSQSSARITPQTLKTLFNLTKTEAKVTLELVNGASLDETANNLNIAKNTVKVHLRHIFQKTQTQRQTELVHRVLSSIHL